MAKHLNTPKRSLLLMAVMAVICLSACVPRKVHQAQQVVAQADSLWANGGSYGDSAALAQAYRTLHDYAAFPLFNAQVSDDYVHACYHYGRLMRDKDDPVSAMQAFIHATHARSNDYHILGRIYSNMGTIAHLAGEFPLSYDMFERSADMFLQGGDTLLYYYDLNNMAFELAEQRKIAETLDLLAQIESHCADRYVLKKINETKADAYLCNQQYDSAIFYARKLLQNNNYESTPLIICAQAYSYLGNKDSATYYAEKVLALSASLSDLNNALYILTNDDETKDKQSIRKTAADRSDTQKLIEIRQGKLSQAVQLLQMDLHRKPDRRWLYAVVGTALVIGLVIWIYIRRKRRKHQLLSQQLEDLATMNNTVQQRHEQIIQEHTEYTNSLAAQIEQNCYIFMHSEDFPHNMCWKDYDALCKIINDNFGMIEVKLRNRYHLSEKEIRLCILVLLGISGSRQLAGMLFYAESGMRTFKNRVAKKIGTNSVELRHFLINLAVNNVLYDTNNEIVYA